MYVVMGLDDNFVEKTSDQQRWRGQKQPQKKRQREKDHTSARKANGRKRAAAACEECRARKRKCDGNFPACEGCNKRMSQCVYSSKAEAWEWNQNMIRTLKARLDELENISDTYSLQVEPQLAANGDSADAEPSQTQRSLVGLAQTDNICFDGTKFLDAQSGNNSIQTDKNQAPQGGVGGYPSSVTQSTTVTAKHSHDSCLSEHTPHNSSASANLNELLKPLEIVAQEHASGTLSSEASPNTVTGRSLVKTGCSCDRSLDSLSFNLPLRRQADDLLRLYFHRHNRMFPILDQDNFMCRYRWLWQPRQNAGPMNSEFECLGFCKNEGDLKLFLTLLNIVFALATLIVPGEPDQNVIKADNFFADPWMIGLHELLDFDVGFKPVQIGLLMTLYLNSTEKFSKCWNVLGLTISMARNKGLDCNNNAARGCDFDYQYPYQLMQEMRARLWYTCILLDTEVSLSFGRSYTIDTSTLDASLSLPIDGVNQELSFDERESEQNIESAAMEYFVQCVKLHLLLRQAMEVNVVNVRIHQEDARRVNSVKFVAELHDLVIDWFEQLPQWLKYEQPASEEPIRTEVGPHSVSIISRRPLLPVDLSKRLFARFLHVKQLTLRPTLVARYELLSKPQVNTGVQLMRNKLYSIGLDEMATQCVLSAVQLNDFLADQIRLQDFVCWWNNTSYLHTCGSTILLARACKLQDPSLSTDRLASSWVTCLKHLSCYTKVSGVAQNCHSILQEKVKQVSSKLPRSEAETSSSILRKTVQTSRRLSTENSNGLRAKLPITETTAAVSSVIAEPALFDHSGQITILNQSSLENHAFLGLPSFPTSVHDELDTDFIDMMNDYADGIDITDTLSWPTMPYLAQLEMRSYETMQ